MLNDDGLLGFRSMLGSIGGMIPQSLIVDEKSDLFSVWAAFFLKRSVSEYIEGIPGAGEWLARVGLSKSSGILVCMVVIIEEDCFQRA
jgi:hypothetical protein